MKRISSLLLSFVAVCFAATALAQVGGDVYVVRFKDSQDGTYSVVSPYIPGPSPVVATVPAPDVKAYIEQVLQLRGEVLGIYPRLNGALLRIGAEEAERLRADARVVSVETYASQSPPLPWPVSSKNNPQLSINGDYVLQIPQLDYNGIPGLYQDATVEYSPVTKSWRLTGVKQAVPFSNVSDVKVIVTTEVPAQVFLQVTGGVANSCGQQGQVGMNQVDNSFTVYLFYQLARGEKCLGLDSYLPFQRIIPLEVYGLRAGTYTYSFNGRFTGSFTLPVDNVLK